MGTIREGRWLCHACSNENRGSHTTCKSCGNTRGEDVEFYLPGDAPAVINPTELVRAKAGPDWHCDHCGTDNPAKASNCSQCGNDHTADDLSRQIKVIPKNHRKNYSQIVRRPAVAASELIGSPRTRIIISGILLLCLFITAWLALTPQRIAARVTGFSWERTIFTERLKTVREEDWSVPTGGRTISQEQAVHHYDQVLTHYETRTRQVAEQVQVGTETVVTGHRDLGNGYFEDITSTRPVYETQYRTETYQDPVYRDEPVYRTRYTYDIDRWVRDKEIRATAQDRAPYWPDFAPTRTWREEKRQEEYSVIFQPEQPEKVNKHPITYTTVTEREWQTFQPGEKYIISRNRVGMILRIEPARE